jgi:DNA-binding winged helix-turn-helix (wHTH) protein
MDAFVAGETLEFEGWRFDTRTGDLFSKDPRGAWAPVSIGARARNVLAILLQQPGVLVSKDAIIDAVWPNVTVEPNNSYGADRHAASDSRRRRGWQQLHRDGAG